MDAAAGKPEPAAQTDDAEEGAAASGPRPRRGDLGTLDAVVRLLRDAKRIVVVCGAGISVACGIPDFRSSHGLYKLIEAWDLDLPSPEALFDIEYFDEDPARFYRFARQLFPGSLAPSRMHRFLAALEATGRLLRVYTQNIDGLEKVAGIRQYVPCHGSLTTASCRAKRCRFRCAAGDIAEDVRAGRVPRCPRPTCAGVIKPDIVFFGEPLPKAMSAALTADRARTDCLLVIGTSLAVAPISTVVGYFPASVPQIVINKTPIRAPQKWSDGFDAQILGDAEEVADYLVAQLGLDLAPVAVPSEGAGEHTQAVENEDQVGAPTGADVAAGAAPDSETPLPAAPALFPASVPCGCPPPPPNPCGLRGSLEDISGGSRRGARSRKRPRRFEASVPARPRPAITALLGTPGRRPVAARAHAGEALVLEPGVFAFVEAEDLGPLQEQVRRVYGRSAAPVKPMVEVVFCDKCQARVQSGEAFRSCIECFGYDLCESCFAGRHGHVHPHFSRQVLSAP